MPPKKAPAAAVPKRGRSTSSIPEAPAAKKSKTTPKKAATPATAGACRPKTDEHFRGTGMVYVDDSDSVAWSVKLNQTNIGSNNNKFYMIQLIEVGAGRYTCFTRWGRVGEPGQNDTADGSLEVAKKTFQSKFRDKTKNDWNVVKLNPTAFKKVDGKYDLVDTEAQDGPAAPVPAAAPAVMKASKLAAELQQMLSIIFNKDMFRKKMQEKSIDAQRMPLGKLTANQVQKGYEALEALEKLLDASSAKKKVTAAQQQKLTETLRELSSKFYTIIPHDFGRSVPPVINTSDMVLQKYDLLHMLNDIQIAVAMDEAAQANVLTENPLDTQYKELGCSLQFVDPKSKDFQLINTYTTNTQGYRKCRIRRAFRVNRPQDKERMQKDHGKEPEGRYLLWHGTNIAVVAAILKSGLRIMPHAGGRVGRGLYFASENGKSSSYVGCDGHTGFMFLVEVCMGSKIHRIQKDDSSLNHDKVNNVLKATSVLACGKQEPDSSKQVLVPGEWGKIIVPQGAPKPQPDCTSSSFSQSEYLVYEESRARIKYILEMDF